MKIIRLSTARAAFGFFLLTLTPVFAQHQPGMGDHKHSSPHGGVVKTAGNYHLELAQKNGALTVYLLDANEKPMSVAGAMATALLQTPDGTVTTVKLPATGTQQFGATLDKPNAARAKSFRKAIVNVAVKGQSASASFDLTAPGVSNKHTTHQH